MCGVAITFTITAADLSKADSDIKNFREGDYVIVNSDVHNIAEEKFIVTSIEHDLSDPSKSQITFGTQNDSITSQVGGSVSYNGNIKIIDTTKKQNENYDALGAAANALNNARLYTDSRLDEKVDKIEGKGLSTNDFTDTEKSKLSGIEAGANKTIVDSALSTTSMNPVQNKVVAQKINATDSVISALSNNVQSAFNSIDNINNALDGHTVGANVPSNANFTDYQVSQNSYEGNENLRLLLSHLPSQASDISYVYKCSKFTANPYTGELKANKFTGELNGNAASATRLQTARTINGTPFDGTSDIYLNMGRKWSVCGDNSGNGWYKFLSKAIGNYEDFSMTLLVTGTHASSPYSGFLCIHVRRDGTNVKIPKLGWLFRYGWGSGSVMAVKNGYTIDFYIQKPTAAYARIFFTVLDAQGRIQGSTAYTPCTDMNPTTGLTAAATSKDLT